MQRLTPFVGQLLPVADGIELGQVVFVARGVFVADSFLVLVQSVEIFSEVPTAISADRFLIHSLTVPSSFSFPASLRLLRNPRRCAK